MAREHNRFLKLVGGRKQLNGYVFSTLATVAAYKMESATFETYLLWLAMALLGTSAIVAYEDIKSNGG